MILTLLLSTNCRKIAYRASPILKPQKNISYNKKITLSKDQNTSALVQIIKLHKKRKDYALKIGSKFLCYDMHGFKDCNKTPHNTFRVFRVLLDNNELGYSFVNDFGMALKTNLDFAYRNFNTSEVFKLTEAIKSAKSHHDKKGNKKEEDKKEADKKDGDNKEDDKKDEDKKKGEEEEDKKEGEDKKDSEDKKDGEDKEDDEDKKEGDKKDGEGDEEDDSDEDSNGGSSEKDKEESDNAPIQDVPHARTHPLTDVISDLQDHLNKLSGKAQPKLVFSSNPVNVPGATRIVKKLPVQTNQVVQTIVTNPTQKLVAVAA